MAKSHTYLARQGRVFGITLTEITLILVFVLLIIAGLSAAELERQTEEREDLLKTLENLEMLEAQVLELERNLGSPLAALPEHWDNLRAQVQAAEELSSEMRDVKAERDRLRQERDRLAGKVRHLVFAREGQASVEHQRIEALTADLEKERARAEALEDEAAALLARLEDAETAIESLRATISDLEAQAGAAAGASTADEGMQDQIASLQRQLGQVRKENEELKEARDNALRQATATRTELQQALSSLASGKARGRRDCWSSDDQPEYLVEITIRGQAGFEVRAIWPAARDGDVTRYGLTRSAINRTMTTAVFKKTFSRLDAVSREEDCVHWARVRDRGPASSYKRQISIIGMVFYYREVK